MFTESNKEEDEGSPGHDEFWLMKTTAVMKRAATNSELCLMQQKMFLYILFATSITICFIWKQATSSFAKYPFHAKTLKRNEGKKAKYGNKWEHKNIFNVKWCDCKGGERERKLQECYLRKTISGTEEIIYCCYYYYYHLNKYLNRPCGKNKSVRIP